LVLESGRIVQEGTHRDLLGEEGLYRRLSRAQSGPVVPIDVKRRLV
jgi:ABC-type multidrug transport system fused ATPase/permease subunit